MLARGKIGKMLCVLENGRNILGGRTENSEPAGWNCAQNWVEASAVSELLASKNRVERRCAAT